jgi:hypothetical protein
VRLISPLARNSVLMVATNGMSPILLNQAFVRGNFLATETLGSCCPVFLSIAVVKEVLRDGLRRENPICCRAVLLLTIR